MSVKDWVTRTQRTLILQGTKLDEKAETPVTMITTESLSNGGVQDSNKVPYQGDRSNKKRQQVKRYGRQQGQLNGKAVTDCGYCNLIREKDVSQEYVQRNFSEMHNRVTEKALWPNQCLPWIMLDINERIKIVQDSKVFCRICLRLLGMGATSNSCGAGRHLG